MSGRLLRALSALLCLLPEPAARGLARALGWIWWYVLRYRRAIILENLTRAFPDLAESARRRLGLAACRHLVHTLVDFLRVPRHLDRGVDGVVRVEGLDCFARAKAKGRGVLCLTGHLGSFELAVAGAAPHVHPASLVVKRFPPSIDRFFTELRVAAGLRVIPAEGALRPILRALAANEAVAFVLDQNATRKIGVFVDFFGEQACTMSALAVIALRTGAPVVGVTIYRDASGINVLSIGPELPPADGETREEAVRATTQRYTRFLEDAIRAHPEQWLWTHKRWRTRPKG